MGPPRGSQKAPQRRTLQRQQPRGKAQRLAAAGRPLRRGPPGNNMIAHSSAGLLHHAIMACCCCTVRTRLLVLLSWVLLLSWAQPWQPCSDVSCNDLHQSAGVGQRRRTVEGGLCERSRKQHGPQRGGRGRRRRRSGLGGAVAGGPHGAASGLRQCQSCCHREGGCCCFCSCCPSCSRASTSRHADAPSHRCCPTGAQNLTVLFL